MSTAADGPVVETPFGSLRGRWHVGPDQPPAATGVGVTQVFRGIRYAVADRFGAPTPIRQWDGVGDATRHGSRCPQLPGALDRLLGGADAPASEDCLHLDVYTPACDGARRPVLVWIHGGAFVTGSGAMPWYHGSNLARLGDVVVVTCNYRLGAFGFTGTDDVGLADQLAVLGWVHEAIASFGGDPERITVFGESAGGASVVALLAASAGRGLFHRAWAMSASLPQLRTAERAHEVARRLSDAAGVDNVDGLGRLGSEQLLAAQVRVLADAAGALTAFAPTSPGGVLPGDALAGAARDPRPLVMGSTRDEMQLFTAFDPALATADTGVATRAFARRFGEGAHAAFEAYRAHRPGANTAQLISAMQTDEMFRIPARRLADDRAEFGGPTWSYWFTYASPAFGGLLGSCHGLDIPFAFHNLDRPGAVMFTGDGPERQAVADEFAGALLRFAHTGDPGWSRYDRTARVTRRIDVDSTDLADPEPELHRLWIR